MSKKFLKVVTKTQKDFFRFLNKIAENERKLLVKGELLDIFNEFRNHDENEDISKLAEIIENIQESVCLKSTIFMEIREKIAQSDYFKFNIEESSFEKIPVVDYLKAKEFFRQPTFFDDILAIDFKPFYDKMPSSRDVRNIGAGVEYLNRYLSSQMFNNADKWRNLLFNFLRLHKYESQQLLLNDRILDSEQLIDNIDKTLEFLNKVPGDTPYLKIKHDLQNFGFEIGLGSKAEKISESLKLLNGLLVSPDNNILKDFISRIPMIFNIAIVSPHGYFAQEGVLGLPDTGGQVVYILDQVKALEKAMAASLKDAGLNILPKIIILTRLIPRAEGTTCNQRLEKVYGTKNSWILRVPFRTHNKEITDGWISRFEIYPYLEEFAEDAERELLAELGRRPDLIIGNYTDGNIVATIMARKFKVTQCNIAHALEKTKYLYSALYWKELEEQYHFSLQFTADLIAMNSADYIITSSLQEIAGTESTIGQYESYKSFTMPELYRVKSGINLFHPKFNVVSPGVNSKVYFPCTKKESRNNVLTERLERLLLGDSNDPDIKGNLTDPDKTPIFSMARLDRIKNLTSLVRWFGECKELQEVSNLIIVAGKLDPAKSVDAEEKEQIYLMHNLMDEFDLHDKMRWIGKLFRKDEAGEAYRIIADKKGIFIQPGLMEGFGLTVLEAMVSGLPVFATQYGGPSEIIIDGKSGFHIDPSNSKETKEKILKFIRSTKQDANNWHKISKQAVDRVNHNYNWKLYSEKLLSLAKIYGFWKYSINLEASELYSYLDVLYYLLYKPMARKLLEKHDQLKENTN